jgi:fructose-1,6-bisphosphatase/inositol monophosphatase family enzyme
VCDGDGPVKVADKEIEEAIVSIILENFPSHAVFWRRNQVEF